MSLYVGVKRYPLIAKIRHSCLYEFDPIDLESRPSVTENRVAPRGQVTVGPKDSLAGVAIEERAFDFDERPW